MDDHELIIKESLTVFYEVKKKLLPTPSKPFYVYNLRDLWKLFQGISIIKSEIIFNIEDFTRLWYHEYQRVFVDKLIEKEESNYILDLLE